MAGRETQFNRKKENYLAKRRNKIRQIKKGQETRTIDSKKARQQKLFERKQKRKEEKRQKKASKMEVDDDE